MHIFHLWQVSITIKIVHCGLNSTSNCLLYIKLLLKKVLNYIQKICCWKLHLKNQTEPVGLIGWTRNWRPVRSEKKAQEPEANPILPLVRFLKPCLKHNFYYGMGSPNWTSYCWNWRWILKWAETTIDVMSDHSKEQDTIC